MKRVRFILLITSGILFFACNNNNNTHHEEKPIAISGEQLFKINCAQCHRPDADYVGAGLRDVVSRWNNKSLLYEFVRSPQEVIAKDPYAKALFEKWNRAFMQPFPNLTNEEIDSIFNYCNTK